MYHTIIEHKNHFYISASQHSCVIQLIGLVEDLSLLWISRFIILPRHLTVCHTKKFMATEIQYKQMYCYEIYKVFITHI